MIRRAWECFAVFIASVFFIGYIPWASGTAASAAAMGLSFFLPTESPVFLIFIIIFCVVSVPLAYTAEKVFNKKDDHRIVIDELAGYFTAVALLPHETGYLVAAFVLFRIFDIFKPSIIYRSQNLPYGIGVIVDDLLAGAAANLVLQIFRYGF